MQRRPLILVSLLLAAFVINLDITIVNVALPTLVRELHASNSQLQWVVDAYSLVFAALLLASRQPQRPPRPQGISARRPGRVRSRQHRRRSDLYRRRADRRPLLHGARRRDDLPRHPLADLERVHRAGRARPRDRPLGRDGGHRDRARPDRRGLAARAVQLDEHLLRDGTRRRCRRRARRLERADLARSGRDQDRRPGTGALERGDGAADLHADRGPQPRLEQRPQPRGLRTRSGAVRRLHRPRAHRRRADARPRPLPQPSLHRRQRLRHRRRSSRCPASAS